MQKKFIILSSILAIGLGLILGFQVYQSPISSGQENNIKTSVVNDPEDQNKQIELYFFYGSTCPHCKKENKFLETLQNKYPQLLIHRYEVYNSPENADLLLKFYEACGEKKSIVVPGTFIGEEVIIGYLNDETTGRKIEQAIVKCLQQECPSPMQKITKVNQDECATCQCHGEGCDCKTCDCKKDETPDTVIPTIFGNINISKFSLPVLTVILGTLDGFNPCAMWVLVLLLALLINTKSRKKMLLVGGTFILTSGIVYFLILAAWLNLFLYIGYISITRLAIGVVAIIVGVWQIKGFMTFEPNVCKVTSRKEKWHKRMIDQIKKITQPAALPATFIGIVFLAFAVNLVEFFCSAGLPAIYTKVLSLNNTGTINYYLYLLLYIFFFMLDDMLVFTVAFITLSKTGFTDKYSRYSTLLGGLIILLLGLLLIFKPEWLMFGS